jgi:hypothetical protein
MDQLRRVVHRALAGRVAHGALPGPVRRAARPRRKAA